MEQENKRQELENKLKNMMFIVGGGAWQALWENEDKPVMGYNVPSSREVYEPNEKDLKSSIRPELLKRFRNKVLVMKPMTKNDYKALIFSFADQLPVDQQISFKQRAIKNLKKAVSEQLGMRYFEEVLTDTLCSASQNKEPSP